MWNMDAAGVRLALLVLLIPAGCRGSELSVDVRPPAGTVGSSALFTVSLNPPAESLYYIQWLVNTTNIITYLNGQNITNPLYTERITFHSSNGSMELKNLTVTDTGIYAVNVQVTSSSPTLKNTVSFTVYKKISGVTISGLTPPLIAGKSSLNLSCEATAGDIVDRLWLKDGHLLSPSDRVTFSPENITMTIGTVEKGDTGRYECRLSNPASSSSAECTVTVNYGPESVRIQGENTVWIDTEVEFQCSASSEPPADFSWTFNGTSTGVKTAVFTIERATRNNTGNYVCVASNVVTTLTSSSTVHTLVVQDGHHGGLSGGEIAGIVIGVLLILAILAGGGFFIMKKKRVWMFADDRNGITSHSQPTGQQAETVYTDVTCVPKPGSGSATGVQTNGTHSQTQSTTPSVTPPQSGAVIYSQVKSN